MHSPFSSNSSLNKDRPEDKKHCQENEEEGYRSGEDRKNGTITQNKCLYKRGFKEWSKNIAHQERSYGEMEFFHHIAYDPEQDHHIHIKNTAICRKRPGDADHHNGRKK